MKICIVTPYYKEDRLTLERNLKSVEWQEYPCTHMLISEGFPHDFIDELPVRHVKLGIAHGDYGDTPRAIGAMLAASEGFDAVAFLDADNCFLPDHIANMVAEAQQSGADIVTSRRFLMKPDLQVLAVPDDLDEGQTSFCDSNCYFITRSVFPQISKLLLKPKELSVIGDRIFWLSLQASGYHIHRSQSKSVCYFTLWASHYRLAGENVPAEAKTLTVELQKTISWWKSLTEKEQEKIRETVGFPLDLG